MQKKGLNFFFLPQHKKFYPEGLSTPSSSKIQGLSSNDCDFQGLSRHVQTLSLHCTMFPLVQTYFIRTPIDLLKACVRASVLLISSEYISLPAKDVNGVSAPSD